MPQIQSVGCSDSGLIALGVYQWTAVYKNEWS